MRPDGNRTKKLKLALYFQLRGPARWGCEQCRSAGLESKRGCQFAGAQGEESERLVWVHGDIGSTKCPKALLDEQCTYWLELFSLWRWGRGSDLGHWPARDVEAMVLVEEWLKEEQVNGSR